MSLKKTASPLERVAKIEPTPTFPSQSMNEDDFGLIRGQEAAKRAMTIALTGAFCVALAGPVGCGKSQLAAAFCLGWRRLPLPISETPSVYEVTTPRFAPTLTDAARLENMVWQDDCERNAPDAPIHCEVPAVSFRDLIGKQIGTTTEQIVDRVKAARAYLLDHSFACNAQELLSTLSVGCHSLLKQAHDELGLTPHSMFCVAEVARTIAALDGTNAINECHVAEAVQYRLLDRR